MAVEQHSGRISESREDEQYAMKLFVRDIMQFEKGNDQSYADSGSTTSAEVPFPIWLLRKISSVLHCCCAPKTLVTTPALRTAFRYSLSGISSSSCFKIINDRYGHDEGDFSIKLIGELLTETVDSSGLVGRVGGDEFASDAQVFPPHISPR